MAILTLGIEETGPGLGGYIDLNPIISVSEKAESKSDSILI